MINTLNNKTKDYDELKNKLSQSEKDKENFKKYVKNRMDELNLEIKKKDTEISKLKVRIA
ncbi:MAG: hypothetical protein MRERC_6c033 [Mycoplasmataceae bacterium RC_NB112A]|nr:MAG: hypothetical protein MRERC_13c034 [Mycoplasmataceae bacterium RC_NB112A]KLL01946.1 MAG: hypothetical protein MRERC_6c033 [Mycoplasmataceae bacterium RC_NB112A]